LWPTCTASAQLQLLAIADPTVIRGGTSSCGSLPRRPEYPGGDGCMSHLLLEDCARLKTEFPERFHFLLSNHELAELGDFLISKSRRMLNMAFRFGINEMYG
jgi:hypothetical protein